MTEEEIEEFMKDHEAKKRAKLLEIIGDIPDAEIKPPENVLFVCKLNPVTTDDDLELIFSRFGKINSCEVIRDRRSGDSLCYAFIEFDRKEDCENGYFKMNNALIDDRRIHVDFSQSVAKYNWRGKGTGTGYIPDVKNYKSNQGQKYRKNFEDENVERIKYENRYEDKKSMTHRDRSREKYSNSREISKNDRHYYSQEKSERRKRDEYDEKKENKKRHNEHRHRTHDDRH